MIAMPTALIGVHSAAILAQCATLMGDVINRAMKTWSLIPLSMMKVGKRYLEAKKMTVEERARELQKELANTFGRDHYDEVAREITAIEKALRDQIEDCAKKADDEVMRLDKLSMEYKQKGDLETATRFSACTVTSARLGRIIRALAAPGESEQQKGD